MIEFIKTAIDESRQDSLAYAYQEMAFWRRFRARTDSDVIRQWCDYFLRIARHEADEAMEEMEHARAEKEALGIQRAGQGSDRSGDGCKVRKPA